MEAVPIGIRPRRKKGFIDLTSRTAKRWSRIIKPDKIKKLGDVKANLIQKLDFFFVKYFYRLYILPDGRLYLISDIGERNFNKQVLITERLKSIIVKSISKNWKNKSKVLFLPMSIVQPARRS